MTGVPHLFGGEAKMLAGMRGRLAAYGFTARPGVAQTIGAAWALARFHPSPSAGRVRRKAAGVGAVTDQTAPTRHASHDTLPAQAGEGLKNLPIEALRIDGESARTLRRLGLKTIGSLLDIPRASLARRFRGETIPENVLIRLDEAMGVRDEPLNPLNLPSAFMAHRTLMQPVITSKGLEAILVGLVTALTRDLEKTAQGATRLILKLFRSDGSRVSLPAGLSAPSRDPRHLLRILKPKLETVDAGFGIDAMTLEACETGPTIVQQYGFMEDGNSSGLEHLNDRVMNRHETEIAALQALESHIPEWAEAPLIHPSATFSPFAAQTGRRGTPQPPATLPFSPHDVRGEGAQRADEGPSKSRPLLIFDCPEPAAVIASVPDGPPMRFTWRRVTRRVVKSQGPERIAPEWWRLGAGGIPRDYYVIEDEVGRRYWLYREGLYGETGDAQPKWFVHGLSA